MPMVPEPCGGYRKTHEIRLGPATGQDRIKAVKEALTALETKPQALRVVKRVPVAELAASQNPVAREPLRKR